MEDHANRIEKIKKFQRDLTRARNELTNELHLTLHRITEAEERGEGIYPAGVESIRIDGREMPVLKFSRGVKPLYGELREMAFRIVNSHEFTINTSKPEHIFAIQEVINSTSHIGILDAADRIEEINAKLKTKISPTEALALKMEKFKLMGVNFTSFKAPAKVRSILPSRFPEVPMQINQPSKIELYRRYPNLVNLARASVTSKEASEFVGVRDRTNLIGNITRFKRALEAGVPKDFAVRVAVTGRGKVDPAVEWKLSNYSEGIRRQVQTLLASKRPSNLLTLIKRAEEVQGLVQCGLVQAAAIAKVIRRNEITREAIYEVLNGKDQFKLVELLEKTGNSNLLDSMPDLQLQTSLAFEGREKEKRRAYSRDAIHSAPQLQAQITNLARIHEALVWPAEVRQVVAKEKFTLDDLAIVLVHGFRLAAGGQKSIGGAYRKPNYVRRWSLGKMKGNETEKMSRYKEVLSFLERVGLLIRQPKSGAEKPLSIDLSSTDVKRHPVRSHVRNALITFMTSSYIQRR